MKTPHKHAELIKAWADGATIQFLDPTENVWTDITDAPSWRSTTQYRIKQEPLFIEGYVYQNYATASYTFTREEIPHTCATSATLIIYPDK